MVMEQPTISTIFCPTQPKMSAGTWTIGHVKQIRYKDNYHFAFFDCIVESILFCDKEFKPNRLRFCKA